MNAQTGLLVFILILNFAAMALFYAVLRSRFSKKKLTGELRGEVDKLITDLGREADRDVALLESRIQSLRSLIDEADRRIVLADREFSKRYEAAKRLEGGSENVHSVPKAESVPVQTVKAEPITVYTRPAFQRSETQIKPVVPLHERVLDMARKGISAEMIATTLSVSLGEIELILDMNSSSL